MKLVLLCCCVFLLLLPFSNGEREKRQKPVRRVVSIINEPFLMPRDEGDVVDSSNPKYKGYVVDLLASLGEITGEEYEIYIVPDGKYGAKLRNGSWNGMMGQLVSKEADLCVAPLTESYSRANVVDFGPAFMTSSIRMLYKKPTHVHANMFTPFSMEVWICIVAVFVVTGIGLQLILRFSPGSENPEPQNRACLANYADAYWILIKSFSLQGVKDHSLPLAARVLVCGWLAFSVVTVGIFFASLVAWYPAIVHGVMERVPFTDSRSLLDSGLRFGCVYAGATRGFFSISSGTVYQKMFHRMQGDRSFVKSTELGVQMVRDGNYVLLGESMMFEYVASRKPCDLMVAGELISSNHYSIATPKGSDLKDVLDMVILQLAEEGTLELLQKKWWTDRSECGNSSKTMNTDAIAQPEVVFLRRFLETGPVIIVAVGIGTAVCITVGQHLWMRRKARSKPSPEETDAPKEKAEQDETEPQKEEPV